MDFDLEEAVKELARPDIARRRIGDDGRRVGYAAA